MGDHLPDSIFFSQLPLSIESDCQSNLFRLRQLSCLVGIELGTLFLKGEKKKNISGTLLKSYTVSPLLNTSHINFCLPCFCIHFSPHFRRLTTRRSPLISYFFNYLKNYSSFSSFQLRCNFDELAIPALVVIVDTYSVSICLLWPKRRSVCRNTDEPVNVSTVDGNRRTTLETLRLEAVGPWPFPLLMGNKRGLSGVRKNQEEHSEASCLKVIWMEAKELRAPLPSNLYVFMG